MANLPYRTFGSEQEFDQLQAERDLRASGISVLNGLRDSELTKLLGWPGYWVYRHEINERAKTLKL